MFSRFDTIHERDKHPASHRTTAQAALIDRIAWQKRHTAGSTNPAKLTSDTANWRLLSANSVQTYVD